MRSDTCETRMNVLLVEDNPGDARLLREALEEVGIPTDLTVVSDGEAALQYLQGRGQYGSASRPDLVLLDLGLPRVSGLEVLTEMKRGSPALQDIPVIVLTASQDAEDMTRSFEMDAHAYLTKPDHPGDFVELATAISDLRSQMDDVPH